jgi:hypothetical protein
MGSGIDKRNQPRRSIRSARHDRYPQSACAAAAVMIVPANRELARGGRNGRSRRAKRASRLRGKSGNVTTSSYRLPAALNLLTVNGLCAAGAVVILCNEYYALKD